MVICIRGLAFGFQAAMASMDFLSEARALDKEIVAIVETEKIFRQPPKSRTSV